MFVDLPQSVAGRQKFGTSIGLITAAFFEEQGKDIGVGGGPGQRVRLQTTNFKPGNLIGVVQIRYIEDK
jgi:hypothetical protein